MIITLFIEKRKGTSLTRVCREVAPMHCDRCESPFKGEFDKCSFMFRLLMARYSFGDLHDGLPIGWIFDTVFLILYTRAGIN